MTTSLAQQSRRGEEGLDSLELPPEAESVLAHWPALEAQGLRRLAALALTAGTLSAELIVPFVRLFVFGNDDDALDAVLTDHPEGERLMSEGLAWQRRAILGSWENIIPEIANRDVRDADAGVMMPAAREAQPVPVGSPQQFVSFLTSAMGYFFDQPVAVQRELVKRAAAAAPAESRLRIEQLLAK